MMIRDARVVGDQVKCWHCPATLGQIVNGQEEPLVLAVPDYYRTAPVPAVLAGMGIRTVLVIAPRAKEGLARTGLPWRRPLAMDKDGGVRVRPSGIFAMPTLMPCMRPGCGEPNRVVDIAHTSVG